MFFHNCISLFFCLLLASIDYIVYHSSGLHPSCTIPTKQTKRSHLLWAETDCYLCGSQDFCCCGVHLALTEQIVTFHITQEVATFCMVRGGAARCFPPPQTGRAKTDWRWPMETFNKPYLHQAPFYRVLCRNANKVEVVGDLFALVPLKLMIYCHINHFEIHTLKILNANICLLF